MDKSTCQTYNLKNNFLGYRGIPTARTKLLHEEIADTHGVFIFVIPQATRIFDVNECDALLHSVQKKRMRSFPHLSARIILCEIETELVMRFVIIAQSSGASRGHIGGMQMVILIKAWSQKQSMSGMWAQKMNKIQLLNPIVIVSGNELF